MPQDTPSLAHRAQSQRLTRKKTSSTTATTAITSSRASRANGIRLRLAPSVWRAAPSCATMGKKPGPRKTVDSLGGEIRPDRALERCTPNLPLLPGRRTVYLDPTFSGYSSLSASTLPVGPRSGSVKPCTGLRMGLVCPHGRGCFSRTVAARARGPVQRVGMGGNGSGRESSPRESANHPEIHRPGQAQGKARRRRGAP